MRNFLTGHVYQNASVDDILDALFKVFKQPSGINVSNTASNHTDFDPNLGQRGSSNVEMKLVAVSIRTLYIVCKHYRGDTLKKVVKYNETHCLFQEIDTVNLAQVLIYNH